LLQFVAEVNTPDSRRRLARFMYLFAYHNEMFHEHTYEMDVLLDWFSDPSEENFARIHRIKEADDTTTPTKLILYYIVRIGISPNAPTTLDYALEITFNGEPEDSGHGPLDQEMKDAFVSIFS
jgi:hypothetical protein